MLQKGGWVSRRYSGVAGCQGVSFEMALDADMGVNCCKKEGGCLGVSLEMALDADMGKKCCKKEGG